MGSKAGSLLKTLAPLALSIAFPGIGTALGGALSSGLGLGLGAAGTSALGSGLLGAGGGLLQGGGVKGALEGGALGGIGGYVGGGGLNGTAVGRAFDGIGSGISSGFDSVGTALGDLTGIHSSDFPSLSGLLGSGSSGSGTSGLTPQGLQSGSGLTAGASNAPLYNIGGGGGSSFASGYQTPSAVSYFTSGNGYTPPVGFDALAPAAAPAAASSGGIGSLLASNALPIAGAISSLGSNAAAQKDLTSATNKANAQLSPYLQTGGAASGAAASYLGLPGSTPMSSEDILAASPGYEFQRQQGNRALAAQQAASGSLNSGAAQKAAEAFGTGLANQAGQQYFSNLQSTAGQGLGAAGQYGTNTTSLGTAKGAADIATGNTLSQLLSGIGGKRVIGYGADGKPIYGSA